jgi:ubiquinone/menaquinone biosynthesis C-methylase UbiE
VRTAHGRFAPPRGLAIAELDGAEGDPGAYRYLPDSVRAFPTPNQLGIIMRQAGLIDVRWRRLSFGAVALHIGRKPA